jgi:hypothetical protein
MSRFLAVLGASCLVYCLASPALFASCVAGPPLDVATMNASGASETLYPCAIAPGSCSNPGNEPNLAFWNTALLASGDLEDELVVILPGGSQDPTNVTWLGKASGFAGYRTLVLAYEGSVLGACDNFLGADADTCFEEVREEAVTGSITPSLAGVDDVAPEDSLEARLVDMLTEMDALHPADGWGAYLNAGVPDYGSIIVAGYSLGSGHAVYWAKAQACAGVVTISGPTDAYCDGDTSGDAAGYRRFVERLGCNYQMGAWLETGAHATPGDHRYASFHYREADHIRLDRNLRAWKASGVPGNQRSHVFLDVTDGYDFATQTPWPLWTADQHPHYMNLFCAAGGDL